MFRDVLKIFEREKEFLKKAGWYVSNGSSYRWWGNLGRPEEIILTAILVQRSKWECAVKVLENLRRRGLIDFHKLAVFNAGKLEELFKPIGFRKAKARRIIELSNKIVSIGGLEKLREMDVNVLRSILTSIRGIGFETADAIILYALNKPTIPVSKHVRRVLRRLGVIRGNEEYESIRKLILSNLRDLYGLKLFYAGITAVGKFTCKSRPKCSKCILRDICRGRANEFC